MFNVKYQSVKGGIHMWDGGGTNLNLHPLLWVPYHMTLINEYSIN